MTLSLQPFAASHRWIEVQQGGCLRGARCVGHWEHIVTKFSHGHGRHGHHGCRPGRGLCPWPRWVAKSTGATWFRATATGVWVWDGLMFGSTSWSTPQVIQLFREMVRVHPQIGGHSSCFLKASPKTSLRLYFAEHLQLLWNLHCLISFAVWAMITPTLLFSGWNHSGNLCDDSVTMLARLRTLLETLS
jgi:hypothetical protein